MSKGFSNLISMTQAANMNILHAKRINEYDILITGRNLTIKKLYDDLKNNGDKVFKLNKFSIQLCIPENKKEEFNKKGDEWDFEYAQ
jgi:hypothetical protein